MTHRHLTLVTSETSKPQDNDTLISKIAAGDIDAMEALYLKYVHKITSIAAKLLRNSADTEDIVQDTFIDAFRDVSKLRNARHIERWLVGIAIHRAHRRFRRRQLKQRLGIDRSIDDEKLRDQAGISANQEARAELALLDKAFDGMRMKERTCLVLRYLEGYQLEEVAMITGCSLATVKRRLKKAKRIVDFHFEEAPNG